MNKVVRVFLKDGGRHTFYSADAKLGLDFLEIESENINGSKGSIHFKISEISYFSISEK